VAATLACHPHAGRSIEECSSGLLRGAARRSILHGMEETEELDDKDTTTRPSPRRPRTGMQKSRGSPLPTLSIAGAGLPTRRTTARTCVEHLWSPVGATSGNQRQITPSPRRRKQAKSVAVRCPPLPEPSNGKAGGRRFESVRGLRKSPVNRDFPFGSTCTIDNLRWVWIRLWSFQIRGRSSGGARVRDRLPGTSWIRRRAWRTTDSTLMPCPVKGRRLPRRSSTPRPTLVRLNPLA
jgi:hypothetical protein